LAVALVLGVPNGLNNLGLQAALYEAAPAASMGTASGLFQTFRFTGAILSTAVIGIVLGQGASSGGLHALAAVIAAVSSALLVASLLMRRRPAPELHLRRPPQAGRRPLLLAIPPAAATSSALPDAAVASGSWSVSSRPTRMSQPPSSANSMTRHVAIP